MELTLQGLIIQNKAEVWAQRVTECRNSGKKVKDWCRENDVAISSYFKWQKRLFDMAKAQREATFVDVTPRKSAPGIAATVQINGAEVQIHNGAESSTIEALLRILKLC